MITIKNEYFSFMMLGDDEEVYFLDNGGPEPSWVMVEELRRDAQPMFINNWYEGQKKHVGQESKWVAEVATIGLLIKGDDTRVILNHESETIMPGLVTVMDLPALIGDGWRMVKKYD